MRALGFVVVVPLMLVALAVMARAAHSRIEIDLRDERRPSRAAGFR